MQQIGEAVSYRVSRICYPMSGIEGQGQQQGYAPKIQKLIEDFLEAFSLP